MLYNDYNYFVYSEYIRDVRRILDKYANICPCTNFYDINFHKISGELCSILEDMSKEEDKSYIDLVMRSFKPNNFYDRYYLFNRSFSERDLIKNFMMYYMILKGYKYGNRDNFSCLVNDVLSFDVKGYGETYPKILSKTFKRVSVIVDRIVGCEFYKDMTNSRRLLEIIFEKFVKCDEYLDGLYDEYNPKLEVFVDAELLGIDKRKAAMMFEKLVKDPYSNSAYCDNYLYSTILIFEDRFEYVNSRLIDLEGNFFIRKSIFEHIRSLNMNLFETLNKDSEDDSFISCMKIVFDSDSYHELLSKLNDLNEAGKLFEEGKIVESLEFIKELRSDKHKKVYNGRVVAYPDNCMNMVEKPKSIFRREKELYGRIDDSISYEFMEELHYRVDDVDTMISETDSIINKNDLFRIIKRKVKRKSK